MPAPDLNRLRDVRYALLNLHKVLLDAEKARYEKVHGRIKGTGELLQLVLESEWFAWLREISRFVVEIDEAVANKEEPISDIGVRDFLTRARMLLTPEEDGAGFAREYYEALQRDPDIILAHAVVWRQL
ncbi:MAG: hypothetical protein ABIZ80_16430 [Bryobacteraceae bacterium]